MKVAICTPVYRDPSYDYTASLAALLVRPRDFEIGHYACQGQTHTRGRNTLARRALADAVDWLLWIDADHDFPADTLERLLAHNLAFVGCNLARREDPTGPTAHGADGLIWTTPEDVKAGKVEQAVSIGFGLCLIHRRVFEAVGEPWFEGEAEDYDFCWKAIKAGFPPHVDHTLSWDIGHVRESLVTNLHALMDRGRFKLKNG